MRKSIVGALALLSGLLVPSAGSARDLFDWLETGDPRSNVPGVPFCGFKQTGSGWTGSKEGPWENAFLVAKSIAEGETEGRAGRQGCFPMVIIYCVDDCAGCNTFARSMKETNIGRSINTFAKAPEPFLPVNTYWRGTDKASLDALAFIEERLKGAEVKRGSDKDTFIDKDNVLTKGSVRYCSSTSITANHYFCVYGVNVEDPSYTYSYVAPLTTGDGGAEGWKDYLSQHSTWIKDCCQFMSATPPKGPKVPKGNAGFVCGETEYTRLEMTNGAERVYVPLSRAANVTSVETNWLRVASITATNDIRVVWASSGAASTNQEVRVDLAAGSWTAGGKVQLTLMGGGDEKVPYATNFIHCVSSKNGYFMTPWPPGATAEFDWSDFTLDFAAATNKAATYAAQNDTNAYTFVALGSGVWDPNSIAVWDELSVEQILGGGELIKLCETNHISLAFVDRTDPATGASLMSHVVAATGRSGTPYLSRDELCSADAEIAAWKADLAALDAHYTVGDGRSPELALIRPADGSVIGRLNFYRRKNGANVDWTGGGRENFARLRELFAMRDDPGEAANDDPRTAAGELAYGSTVSGNTLNISDQVDVFLLKDVPTGVPFALDLVNVTCPDVRGPGTLAITLVQFTDDAHTAYRTVNPLESRSLTNGVWLVGDSAAAERLAVVVQAYGARCEDGAILPDENLTYAGVAWGGKSTIAYELRLAEAEDDEGEVFFTDNGISEGHPLVLGFGTTTNVEVFLDRSGYTGAKLVQVAVVSGGTTLPQSCYEWDSSTGKAVSWGDLENGKRAFTIRLTGTADLTAPGKIRFGLASGDTFDLWVAPLEDENAPVGHLELQAPGYPETLWADWNDRYVPSGTNLSLWVSRVDGWRDDLSGRISVSCGKLFAKEGETLTPTNYFRWSKFDMHRQELVWQLDELAPSERMRRATLTLFGLDGTPVEHTTLNVCLMQPGVPQFAGADEAGRAVLLVNDTVQYVKMSDYTIPLAGTLPDGWTVEGVERVVRSGSGRLPAGMSIGLADESSGTLRVYGTPTVPSGTDSDDWSSEWWLLLRHQGAEGDSFAYSYPVTVLSFVTALQEKNPMFAQPRSWTGLPVCDLSVRPLQLYGTLDLTLGRDGRMSAKFRRLGNKTIAFSTPAISSMDASGIATYETTTSECLLRLTVQPNQAIGADIFDPDFAGRKLTGSFDDETVHWSASHTAEAWKGLYSLAFTNRLDGIWDKNTLCFGNPSLQARFLSLSQWKTGRATFAGVLPNGRTFSGSATFTPQPAGWPFSCLPILSTSAADDFAALVTVGTNAGECVYSRVASTTNAATAYSLAAAWNHAERGFPGLSYSNTYTVVGSRFAAMEDGWEPAWGTNVLTVCADDQATPGRLFTKSGDWRIGTGSEDEERFVISAALNRNSGAMTGVMRECDVDGKKWVWHPYQWKGAALPGCEPFLLGAYWYNFTTNVENAAGKKMHKSVRCGGSVWTAK